MHHFPTRQYLRLALSPDHEVSVDLSRVQEIIHLDRPGCAATWSGPDAVFVRVRKRSIPLFDLNHHLGIDASTAPRRMVLVEIGHRLHAVAAQDSLHGSGQCSLLDLDTLLDLDVMLDQSHMVKRSA